MGFREWAHYQTTVGAINALTRSDEELSEEDPTHIPMEPEERERVLAGLQREKTALEALHWNDLNREF